MLSLSSKGSIKIKAGSRKSNNLRKFPRSTEQPICMDLNELIKEKDLLDSKC